MSPILALFSRGTTRTYVAFKIQSQTPAVLEHHSPTCPVTPSKAAGPEVAPSIVPVGTGTCLWCSKAWWFSSSGVIQGDAQQGATSSVRDTCPGAKGLIAIQSEKHPIPHRFGGLQKGHRGGIRAARVGQ